MSLPPIIAIREIIPFKPGFVPYVKVPGNGNNSFRFIVYRQSAIFTSYVIKLMGAKQMDNKKRSLQ